MYLVSNIEYPASQYEPLHPEINGVYHEDREVNVSGAVGASQMYRTYNAQFLPLVPGWQIVNTDVPEAYATVQNPDGSVHYYSNLNPATNTYEPSWTSWFGSGNNNVYNAVDYGLTTDVSAGVVNTAALKAAVTAAITANGGTIFIPQGSYYLYGSVEIDTSGTAGIIIAGVSGLTELLQTAPSDIFDVTASGNSCGIRFRDLTLRYQLPTSSGLFAVNITGSDSVTCERVYFKDCPGSFQTASNCEFCGLFDCYIDYGATAADDGSPLDLQTMVSLSGVEDFVAQCVIFQSNNATDCIGISLLGNNNAHFISKTHISDLYTGISITGGGPEGLNGIYVSEVLINTTQNAVIIEPSVAGNTIHDIHFTNCTFAAMNGAGMQTSGVQISIPSGGSPTDVACIYFTGCSAYGWGNAGIEIDAGQNIVITGGQYSSNGQNSPTGESYLGAGIAVLGGSLVTITGADCSGVNQLWKATVPGLPAQLYGISLYPVGGSVSDVTVSGCNVNANKTSGILVSGSGTFPSNVFVRGCDASQFSSYTSAVTVGSGVTHTQNLQVMDCAGYNDQAPELSPPGSPPTGTFYNATFSYYGPITFYVWGTAVDAITIGPLVLGLQTGSFSLPCQVGAHVAYSGLAPTFAAIGM